MARTSKPKPRRVVAGIISGFVPVIRNGETRWRSNDPTFVGDEITWQEFSTALMQDRETLASIAAMPDGPDKAKRAKEFRPNPIIARVLRSGDEKGQTRFIRPGGYTLSPVESATFGKSGPKVAKDGYTVLYFAPNLVTSAKSATSKAEREAATARAFGI